MIFYCDILGDAVYPEHLCDGPRRTSPALIIVRADDETEAASRRDAWRSLCAERNDLSKQVGHDHCFSDDDPRISESNCLGHKAIRKRKLDLDLKMIAVRGF